MADGAGNVDRRSSHNKIEQRRARRLNEVVDNYREVLSRCGRLPSQRDKNSILEAAFLFLNELVTESSNFSHFMVKRAGYLDDFVTDRESWSAPISRGVSSASQSSSNASSPMLRNNGAKGYANSNMYELCFNSSYTPSAIICATDGNLLAQSSSLSSLIALPPHGEPLHSIYQVMGDVEAPKFQTFVQDLLLESGYQLVPPEDGVLSRGFGTRGSSKRRRGPGRAYLQRVTKHDDSTRENIESWKGETFNIRLHTGYSTSVQIMGRVIPFTETISDMQLATGDYDLLISLTFIIPNNFATSLLSNIIYPAPSSAPVATFDDSTPHVNANNTISLPSLFIKTERSTTAGLAPPLLAPIRVDNGAGYMANIPAAPTSNGLDTPAIDYHYGMLHGSLPQHLDSATSSPYISSPLFSMQHHMQHGLTHHMVSSPRTSGAGKVVPPDLPPIRKPTDNSEFLGGSIPASGASIATNAIAASSPFAWTDGSTGGHAIPTPPGLTPIIDSSYRYADKDATSPTLPFHGT